jgi:hypothetical protein
MASQAAANNSRSWSVRPGGPGGARLVVSTMRRLLSWAGSRGVPSTCGAISLPTPLTLALLPRSCNTFGDLWYTQ